MTEGVEEPHLVPFRSFVAQNVDEKNRCYQEGEKRLKVFLCVFYLKEKWTMQNTFSILFMPMRMDLIK